MLIRLPLSAADAGVLAEADDVERRGKMTGCASYVFSNFVDTT